MCFKKITSQRSPKLFSQHHILIFRLPQTLDNSGLQKISLKLSALAGEHIWNVRIVFKCYISENSITYTHFSADSTNTDNI